MARLEFVLYAGLVPTGTIEYSEDSDTGPWTSVTLTETAPALDALADWAAQIATATSLTVDFSWNGAEVVLSASGALWVRLTSTLAELLGFSARVQDADATAVSDETPTGIAVVLVGHTQPTEREEAELDEYRGARAASYHYGRTGEVQIEIGVPPVLYAATSASPLWSGHGAFLLTPGGNVDPYGEDDLDGTMLVFPDDTKVIEHERDEDYLHVTITGSLLDPGETLPAAPTNPTRWQALMGGARFGYAPYYFLRIEGTNKLLQEVVEDAVAPSGYFFSEEPEGKGPLVIDRSPRIGSLVGDDTHFPKAFDGEWRFIDTPDIRAFFGTRPSVITELSADIDADDTTLPVRDSAGLATAVYVGTSRIPFSASTGASLTGATRGSYGRARSYKAGTLVSDAPYIWRQRRCEMFVAMLDPTGRFVQTANILDTACCIATSYVQERPFRDGTEWVLRCRDQVRRLTQPLGVAASGKARWSVNDDTLVKVDLNAKLNVRIEGNGNNQLEDVSVRPFFGQVGAENAGAGMFRASEVRTLIADALDAAWGDTPLPVGRPFWVIDQTGTFGNLPGTGQSYKLKIPIDLDGDDSLITITVSQEADPATTLLLLTLRGTLPTVVSGTSIADCDADILMQPPIGSVTLTVLLDDAEPSELPETGWVVLEGEGSTDYRRYTGFVVDPNDPLSVTLTLDPRDRPSAAQFRSLTGVDVQDGQAADVSCKFYWKMTGKLYDVLRTAIVSTGDAVNGAFDTLPKGQGLGLPDIDEDSFERVFDATFQDLQFNVAAESGTSLEELFSGILKLSQRGLASRRAASGSAVQIAAVSVGSATGGSLVATITDATLMASGGRRPIRVLDLFAGPQAMEVTCSTVAVGDSPGNEGSIVLRDPHLTDWTGDRWALRVPGLSRDSLKDPAIAWATSWFRGGENRQIVEVDVGPHIDAQPGDVVALDVTDPNLWDYANAGPGLDTLGRVLGCQFSMVTGVQTLTLAVDGILSAGPMCPSLACVEIVGDWDGFTGTHFLRSDGASGSYADAATTALARVLLPGASDLGVHTVSLWYRGNIEPPDSVYVYDVQSGTNARARLRITNDGGADVGWYPGFMSDEGSGYLDGGDQFIDASDWVHLAITFDGTTARAYASGVEITSENPSGTFPASDAFILFADYLHDNRANVDVRALAVWSRAITSGQASDLYDGGVSFDPRTLSGGGPDHWYPADGDSGTTVTDRGSAGDCDINLHGGVTIEEDP